MRTATLRTPLLHGPDIRRGQELLVKRGLLPQSAVDGEFGPLTAKACAVAHDRYGFLTGKQSMGDRLIHALEKGAPPSPRHKLVAAARKPVILAKNAKENKVRAAIVSVCRWGIANEAAIHYTQDQRRNDFLHGARSRKLPLYTDCSGFATFCYWLAGAADPSGLNFKEVGFTGTMLQHMRHVTRELLKPGDLIVYGNYPGLHVVVVTDLMSSGEIVVCSHGQEKGPARVIHSVEVAVHNHAPVNFLSIF